MGLGVTEQQFVLWRVAARSLCRPLERVGGGVVGVCMLGVNPWADHRGRKFRRPHSLTLARALTHSLHSRSLTHTFLRLQPR